MEQAFPERTDGPPLDKSQALVVTNDPALRHEFTRALLDEGLAVVADDPAAALRHVVRQPFALVVLAPGAPAHDVADTCAQLRAHLDTADTPILAALARHDDLLIGRTLAAGADDLLVLPFHAGLFATRVRHLLRARARALHASAPRFQGAFDLAGSEARPAEAQHLAHLGSWAWEITSNAMYWSAELSRIVGRDSTGFDGGLDAMISIIHPDERQLVTAAFDRLLSERAPLYQECRIVRPGGEVRLVALRGELVQEVRREARYVLGTVQDITEHARAQATLHLYQQAVAATTNGILITDATTPDCPIVAANPAFLSLTGYAAHEVLGRNCRFIQGPGTDPATVARLRAAITQGQPTAVEILNYRKDGTAFWNALVIAPIHNASGQLSHFVGVQQDVTARREAEVALQEREAALRALFDGALDAILIADDDGRYVDANPAACALFGLARDQLLGRTIGEFSTVEEPASTGADWTQFLQEGVQTGTVILQRPGGEVRYLEYAARAHFLPGRHLSILRDVTTRHQAEAALQASEEYLRALVERSAEITTVVDADGTVRYASPAQWRLLGYPEDASLGSIFDYAHPDDIPHVQELFARLTTTPGTVVSAELRVRHFNGSWPIFEVTATNLLDNPAVRGIVVNSHDITARKQVEAQLIHGAFHDGLTGLPNRALFLDRLSQALDRSARHPGHHCAVLFLDLDRFKTVNDSLGHQAGDQLLVAAARRLEQCVRSGDTVARFGGDEFAILLETTTAAHEAIVVAERIAAAFQRPISLDGQELMTSASIGITICAQGARPDEVLRDADIAMYRAKRSGPGQHMVADPSMHAEIMRRLQLEAELRRAIEREEFVLHYQPKMAMDGRTMRGVEALIRWRHPVRGLISPAEFIPLAEETGLIVPIGFWALRTACEYMRVWVEHNLPPFYVAVNLSAEQFRQPGVAAGIRAILAETGLTPQLLGIELTESVLMEDAATTVTALHELRNIGIRALAIDDFGTGYSSLSYLQRFPVTAIKIDRSFVRDLAANPGNAAIARSIIALGHSLGLEVIAEGVETEAQRVLLEQAGCDHFQGFLVSRPLPADELIPFARALAGAAPA